MTLEEFDRLFEEFRYTAFHLETHAMYAMPEEDQRLRAFRQGLPRPERSVRTTPWLQRVALTTVQGKRWTRVHVIEHPLSEYLRYQLIGYIESQAAGEEIHLADRGQHPELTGLGPDFWLFDASTPHTFGAHLHFDGSGNLLCITDASEQELKELCHQQEVALAHSVSLAEYVATHKGA